MLCIKIKNIIGSNNYVSLNVHNLVEPSRRDDIESCIYVILALIYGKLDWFHKETVDEIKHCKYQVTTNNANTVFNNLLTYVRSLQFEDKPDYDYIIKLLSI